MKIVRVFGYVIGKYCWIEIWNKGDKPQKVGNGDEKEKNNI